jgi:hypothetical protein
MAANVAEKIINSKILTIPSGVKRSNVASWEIPELNGGL